jgi:hypothetical protein
MDTFRWIRRAAIVAIASLLFFAFSDFACAKSRINCDKHPIYCQIKKNHPKLDRKYAMKLSNIIYKKVRKYHIPPRIFVAILMQESRYQLGATGCHGGYRKLTNIEFETEIDKCTDGTWKARGNPLVFDHQKCMDSIPKLVESKVCTDFGIGQIYYKTAKRYKFNTELLLTDLEYSIDASARVLSDFQHRYESREIDWWTRYNARSPRKRLVYKTLVSEYL